LIAASIRDMAIRFGSFVSLPLLAVMLSDCATTPEQVAPRQAKRFAAAVDDVLQSPTRFEIIRLDPMATLDGVPEKLFRGFAEVGRATIDDPEEARRLVELVRRGVERNGGMAAGCFLPRHAISASRGKETVELVICYECSQIYVYPSEVGVLTGSDVEPDVNAIFAAHGL
jgi:hypothetical protein